MKRDILGRVWYQEGEGDEELSEDYGEQPGRERGYGWPGAMGGLEKAIVLFGAVEMVLR